MDFHSMKRKQLQALCKKHRIPANLSNLEMANKLTGILKEKEIPVIQAVVKEPKGILSETESGNLVANKIVKKVRFSPEHELIEFTRLPEMKRRRSRRNSVCPRDSTWSDEIVEDGEINKGTVGQQGRTTREIDELKLMEAGLTQKKRGMNALNCNSGKIFASDVDTIDDVKSEVRSGRVTRLRGKMAAEGVKNASNREGNGENDDEKASDNVHNEKEIVDNHNRVTRSRAHKLTEAPAAEEKKGRKVAKNNGKVAAVRAENDSSSKRGDEGEGQSAPDSNKRTKGNGKVLEEILVSKKIAGEHEMVETQVLLRRSKRKANGVGDSEMLTNDLKKHEVVKIKGSRKTSKPLASDGLQVDAEIIGSEVNPGRRAVLDIEETMKKVEPRKSNRRKGTIESDNFRAENQKRCPLRYSGPESDSLQVDAEIIGSEVIPGRKPVLEIEEPMKKVEPRRSNRRKTMIESDSLRAENENIYPLRSSVPISDSVPRVSEDEKMVLHPTGVLRRSRRKTLGPKLVSATNDTDSAVENLEAEKATLEVQRNTRSRRYNSKCIGEDFNVQQKNKVMKRKRGHVSGEDVVKNNNGSKKVVSSHHGSSGIEKSLSLDVQLSVSKDSESANNLCSKNIISDVELTSIGKTEKKKEEVSNAGSADSSCMNLTNEEELVITDTNSASKIAQLETDSPVSKDQNLTSNTGEVEKSNSLLDIEGKESIEQNITDTDKNDPEAQVYSQTEDSSCDNKINDPVFAEGLDVSGEEVSAEASSFADSLLLGDQTADKTDLKVAHTEAEECMQFSPRVVEHHNDLNHLEASSCVPEINHEDTSETPGEVGAFESYQTDYSHIKITSQLKVPSSGMTRHPGGDNVVEDDNVTEGNETSFDKGIASEMAEAEEDEDHRNARNHSSEFDMPDLSICDRDARIISQDTRALPSEYSVMKSDEQHEIFQAVALTAICTNSADVDLKGSHDDDQMTKREERFIDEGLNSKASETREGDENGEGRHVITPQDKGNFSGEHSLKDFNEQAVLQSFPSVEPTSMCNGTEDHEANLSAEGGETYNYKDKQSEITGAGKRGCLKSHESSKDDWEFSGFNIFDEDRGAVSVKYSMKDLNEEKTIPDLPVVPSPCVNHDEGKSDRECSNTQETSPSTPSSVSETQEQQKSLSAKSNAANTNQRQEDLSNESVLAGNAVDFLRSYAEGEISQVAERLSADEDANHANYGFDKEGSPGACLSDVKSCTISKIVAESHNDIMFQDSVVTNQQHVNLRAGQTESDAGEETTPAISRQSWTEIELQNLFGTTSDEDAPPGLGDFFCQGTGIANMTTSKNKSTTKSIGSVTKKKGTQIEVGSINECATPKNQNVLLSTGFRADNDIDENQLKFLLDSSTKILCGTGYDGSELEDQLTQNKEECLIETDLTIEEDKEDHVTILTQSCLQDEATKKINIGSSGTPMLDTLSCQSEAHHKSEGVLERTTEALFELSGVDLQKSDVPENSHPLPVGSDDDNFFREASIEISSDPEEAQKFIFQKDVTEKGISPINFSKASPDCAPIRESDDRYEGDDKDIYGELYTNSEVAIWKSVSINYNLSQELDQLQSSDELERTCEAKMIGTTLGDDSSEKINKFESVVMEDTSTTVLSKTEYDGCEASEEPLIENTGECQKEINFIREDSEDQVIPVGQTCLYDEGTDNGSESTDGNLDSLSCSPNNFDKLEGCQDMTRSSSEAAVLELSDADLQNYGVSTNSCFPACFEDDNVYKEASLNTSSGPLVAEIATTCIFDSQNSLDEGTSLHRSLKASPHDDELTQRKDTDELNGAKICDEIDLKENSSPDKSDEQEQHINSEMAILKSLSDSDNVCEEEAYKLPCSLELERTFLKTKEAGPTGQDSNNSVSPAESLDAATPAFNLNGDNEKKNSEKGEENSAAQMVQSSIEELHFEEKVEDDTNTVSNSPAFNVIGDNEKKNSEKGEENSAAEMVQSSIQELHIEEKVEDDTNTISTPPAFNLNGENEERNSEKGEENSAAQMIQSSIQEHHFEEKGEDDTSTISNSPASEYLIESDAADTIKEFIDSESTAGLPSDVSCEKSAVSNYEDDIANMPSIHRLETEIKEQEEAALSIEPDQVSRTAVDSPRCIDVLAEGTSVVLDSQKKIVESEDGQMSSSRVLRSTTKKNARTILIHGTPGKAVVNMKEKRSNRGDITTARPAKRIALRDLNLP